ncbi:MAG: glutaminyl-peptide cyclotransferase [Gemmatimonadales bacterium]
MFRRGIPILLLVAACAARAATVAPRGYRVVAEYPHDTSAYTQGLLLEEPGVLLESTGLYGHSTLRRVTLATGAATSTVPLPEDRFGEGLARRGDTLYQLTWQAGIAYRYDRASLRLLDSVSYRGEGWGLAPFGDHLLLSDGSDSLRVIDPATFATVRRIGVRYSSGGAVSRLNELEVVGNEAFANVYQSDWIVRIDLATGIVREVLDLAGIQPKYGSSDTNDNVLNGIAYLPESGHLLVTGKRWPRLFELALDRPPVPIP